MKRFFGILTVSLGLVACSETRQLHEMHDTTEEMNQTTKKILDATNQMQDTTSGVGKTSEAMNNTLNEMDDSARQGTSQVMHWDAMKEMRASKSGPEKAITAGVYFDSFEFQLWSGQGQDATLEKRVRLMNDAAEEFFLRIREFVPDKTAAIDPFAESKASKDDSLNSESSFNAMALAMDEVNRKQDEMIKMHPGVVQVSMYGMIAESLKLQKAVDAGTVPLDTLAPYQLTIQSSRDYAVRLLQARHNVYIAAILSEEVSRKGFGAMVAAATNRFLVGHFAFKPASWPLNVGAFSLARLQTYSIYLNKVLATRQLLRDIGETVQVDPAIQGFIEGAQPQMSAEATGPLAAAQAQFANLIEKVRADAGSRP